MKNNKVINNDKLFKENYSLIEELCLKHYIPSEIATKIGMERHALTRRLKTHNLKINTSIIIKDEKKVCYFCKKLLSLNNFAKKSKNKEDFSSRCKACRKISLIKNRESLILSQIKSRAKRKNIEFNLTIEDIIIPKRCPILNIELNTKDMSIYNKFSPSVDRIDPDKGYIKGNIMIISMRANLMKNDATIEELLNFSKYYMNKKTMNPVGTENIINLFKS